MIPSEAAHDTMEALGEVGLLQFKDLNADKSAFQRTYASQVRFCPATGALALMTCRPSPGSCARSARQPH